MTDHHLPGNPPVPLTLRRSGRARRISLRISHLDGRVTLTVLNRVAEREALARQVSQALAEDVGDGDLTAGLLAPEVTAHARIIARESAVLCGRDWVDAVFGQLDAGLAITWHCADGARTQPGQAFSRSSRSCDALRSSLPWAAQPSWQGSLELK